MFLNFTKKKLNGAMASPPGFHPNLSHAHREVDRLGQNIVNKKSWEVASQPIKQMPMNLFIMYMTGNSISFIPIMMVCMLLVRPIKALMSIKSTFDSIETGPAIPQKIVYLVGNLACLGLALYKCQSMGLLPTHSSDWQDFLENPNRLEYAFAGLNMAVSS